MCHCCSFAYQLISIFIGIYFAFLFLSFAADDENELFKNSPQSQPSNSNQLPDNFNGHQNNFDGERDEGEEDEEDERDADADEEIEETTTCDSFFSGEYFSAVAAID